MSTLSTEEIVNAICNLTAPELVAITKELEQKLGVSAQPQMGTTTGIVPTDMTPVVEQTEFTVTLVSFPADKKMAIVKSVRDLTGMGLLESKQLVEAAPKIVKDSVSKEDAANLMAQLTAAGAVVEVK
jgi:large subunit ribosomal protein L7/L12